MTPDREQQISQIYHEALARDAGERVAYLRETCAGDEGLRGEVQTLLDQSASAADFLATPAMAIAAQLMGDQAGSQVEGRRLGVYQLQGLLGAGGMGEVYRARDTALGRDVAIKILPRAFTRDPDRLARFEREAHLLATLNHPHIGAIYGLEASEGVRALVLELVDGETLADRLERGQVPLTEALTIARQIADALEAAHEKGIVHRDLKPANIKITPAGVVKVLDFGLAKAASGDGAGADLIQSPTVTVGGTREGVILGTAAYMSPEQARGKPVDKRTDIWAFACVLYEMLTGRPAFPGDTLTDTLAAIVEREPEWQMLPATTPSSIKQLLHRCFEKDPNRRLHDVADARLEIDDALTTPAPNARVRSAGVPGGDWRRVALFSAIALIVGAVVATALMWSFVRRAEPVPPRVSRLQITPSGAAALTILGADRSLAITPDGSRLLYVGNNGTQIFVHALDALEPVPVLVLTPATGGPVGTGVPRGLFVSPDGQWIGFGGSALSLWKVAVTGGPAVRLASLDSADRGATWGPDDTIIVATSNLATGLQRVGAAGGPTSVLTRPDPTQGEADHLWPEFLPGGRAVLFTITTATGGLNAAQVAVLDLQTGTHRVLVRGGSHAHYVPSGHLVYAAAGTLRAVAFDLARLETRGTPVPVVLDVVTTASGGVNAVVADDGTLAYVSGGVAGEQRTLVWVDRQGRETPIPAPPRAYVYPRVSPDGTRIVVAAQDEELDLWVWDLGRTTLTRTTADPALDTYPLWTPDGRRLIFSSERAGARNLFWQAADGTGAVDRLTESPNQRSAGAVSPDGRQLIFSENAPATNYDQMQVALDGTRRVTPLLTSPLNQRNGVISPDGRWLAYETTESGRVEISVRPFPDVTSGRWQVSTAGGTRSVWAPNGQELFYVSLTGALMRVGVERAASWAATTPTLLVKERYFTNPPAAVGRTYDIAPDGQRFLMIKESRGSDGTVAPATLIVVQNWVEELKRLVPVN